VFVISPDSVASAVCLQEAAHALSSGKRIIPIVRRAVADALVPEGIAAHNWILLRDEDDFEAGADALVRALDTDLEWVHAHTRLLTRAIEWDRADRDPSFLLRGKDLDAAEARLASGTEDRDPPPTPLQVEYAIASRRRATRGQRVRLGAVSGALVVTAALAIVSLVLLRDALDQRAVAASREQAQAALEQLDTDPELGILLAAHALETARTPEADHALRAALQASPLRTVTPTGISSQLTALSPDGSQLASYDLLDDAMWLTGIDSHGHVATRALETAGEPTSLAFDGSGHRLAAGLVRGNVIAMWDLRAGTANTVLQTAMGRVSAVAFDESGSRIAAAGPGGAVEVWDVAHESRIRTIASGESDLLAVALSGDGSLVAAAGDDPVVRVWNTETGAQVASLEGHTAAVWALAFRPDGQALASGGADTVGRLWSVESGAIISVLRGHAGGITRLAFKRDGTRIVTAAGDATARLWDGASGRTLSVLRGGPWARAQFGPAPGELATVGTDGAIRVWAEDPEGPVTSVRGHSSELWQVDFDPSGASVLATGDDDTTARAWDADTGVPGVVLRGHTAAVITAAFGAGGRSVATGGMDGSIRLWDPTTGKGTVLGDGLGATWFATFALDGDRLATAGDTGTRVWDIASGREVLILPVVAGQVRFDPLGGRIVLSRAGAAADVYDARTGAHELALMGHSGWVNGAAFDPAGGRIITAGDDGTARIWDAVTGAQLLEIRAGAESRGRLLSASFSPDGARVVTGREDGTVGIWDGATGELLATYQAGDDGVNWATFSPDGLRIATAGVDGTIRIFRCTVCGAPDEVLALAGTRVTRTLSPDERVRYLHEEPSPVADASSPSPAPALAGRPSPPPGPATPEPSEPVTTPSQDPGVADLCATPLASCVLPPGRYRPSRFWPGMSIEVPEGFVNTINGQTVVSLVRPAEEVELDFVSGPTAGLIDGRAVPIPSGTDGFMAFISGMPGLEVTDLGMGFVGTRDGNLAGLLFLAENVSEHQMSYMQRAGVTFVLAPHDTYRFFLFDVNGTTVVVVSQWRPDALPRGHVDVTFD